jgi:hypothetical protein
MEWAAKPCYASSAMQHLDNLAFPVLAEGFRVQFCSTRSGSFIMAVAPRGGQVNAATAAVGGR